MIGSSRCCYECCYLVNIQRSAIDSGSQTLPDAALRVRGPRDMEHLWAPSMHTSHAKAARAWELWRPAPRPGTRAGRPCLGGASPHVPPPHPKGQLQAVFPSQDEAPHEEEEQGCRQARQDGAGEPGHNDWHDALTYGGGEGGGGREEAGCAGGQAGGGRHMAGTWAPGYMGAFMLPGDGVTGRPSNPSLICPCCLCLRTAYRSGIACRWAPPGLALCSGGGGTAMRAPSCRGKCLWAAATPRRQARRTRMQSPRRLRLRQGNGTGRQ